ncbi:MAG: protein translocase subunit SecF [Allosphingosinicella sp.]
MRLLKLVPDNTNLNFLRRRGVAFAISSLLIAASIALMATKGLNLGVDFVGGQMMRVTFQQPPQLDELRSRINDLGHGDALVQETRSGVAPVAGTRAGHQILIRMSLPEGGEAAASQAAMDVRNALNQTYPGVRIDAVETVSGKVSEELLRSGALALLFAMIGVSIYIWIRFEWQFGVGALFSLFHDVTITLGVFSLAQWEFDLNVIAALLTLIDYSLNDTIVVYDRIRENLRKFRKMDITSLINLSVNETLSRTIATNLAMLLALGSLFFFGPDVIFSFTAGLLISVIIGTYSTVYIAAPWLIWLNVKSDSFLSKDPVSRAARGLRNETDGAQV